MNAWVCTVRSLENMCHTSAFLRWWFTKRRYMKCMYLHLLHSVVWLSKHICRDKLPGYLLLFGSPICPTNHWCQQNDRFLKKWQDIWPNSEWIQTTFENCMGLTCLRFGGHMRLCDSLSVNELCTLKCLFYYGSHHSHTRPHQGIPSKSEPRTRHNQKAKSSINSEETKTHKMFSVTNIHYLQITIWRKHSERCKHCTLAVVRRGHRTAKI